MRRFLRRAWLPFVALLLGYTAGTLRERVYHERNLNTVLHAHVACLERLERAEGAILAVEPIVRRLWPRESAVWFGESEGETR